MARNAERDAQEMEKRQNQILNAGFELFSEKGIDAVSIQAVADVAGVGVATVYNYYRNKVNLVVAISAKIWSEVWMTSIAEKGKAITEEMNAYELIDFYADVIIRLYRNNPRLLKFSSDYKTFICREKVGEDSLAEQLDALAPIGVLFHQRYEEARENGCIRTDLREEDIFLTISLTMLGMAERYAQGLVWAKKPDSDYTRELTNLKEMILKWVAG